MNRNLQGIHTYYICCFMRSLNEPKFTLTCSYDDGGSEGKRR